ncbi:MAG: AbrB/MazE/SpoVT family DNA-binding domain-containing protein [Crenarchaeota archaeon]|nr:AbrB/MazE/SpoVT family DNA-binding domain-containing protein [Thermoproteota archaeon]
MEDEVIVTRKGQTTIPIKLREKYKIEEGTRLQVLDTSDGILLRPQKSTLDLAGSGSGFSTPEEMKLLLSKIRDLDA